jgi:UDP-N-acetylmuramyl pentapeptide synthase
MTDGDRIMVEDYGTFSLSETHFSGSHNAMNILSVLMVMRDLGIPYGQVCEVIQ